MGFNARFDVWRLPGLLKWSEHHGWDLSRFPRVAPSGRIEAQSVMLLHTSGGAGGVHCFNVTRPRPLRGAWVGCLPL